MIFIYKCRKGHNVLVGADLVLCWNGEEFKDQWGFKLKEKKFGLNIKKNLMIVRAVKYINGRSAFTKQFLNGHADDDFVIHSVYLTLGNSTVQSSNLALLL